MKGKVLQFRGRLSGEIITTREADSENGANEQLLASDVGGGASGFGPDDYSFSWLVVGDRLARFDDNVFTFPSAQDGY